MLKKGRGCADLLDPRRTNGAMVYEEPLFLCRKFAANTPRLRRRHAANLPRRCLGVVWEPLGSRRAEAKCGGVEGWGLDGVAAEEKMQGAGEMRVGGGGKERKNEEQDE